MLCDGYTLMQVLYPCPRPLKQRRNGAYVPLPLLPVMKLNAFESLVLFDPASSVLCITSAYRSLYFTSSPSTSSFFNRAWTSSFCGH
jgi:hypothetical protein